MSDVVVVIGPGSIGQAIAGRVSAGKHGLVAALVEEAIAHGAATGLIHLWQPCGRAPRTSSSS